MLSARPLALVVLPGSQASLIPFIPGDLFKMVLAALALSGAWRLARR